MGLFSKSTTQQSSKPDNVQPAASSSQGKAVASSKKDESPQWRPIFLLVWPSALFKAHWAIFVPDLNDKTIKKGKYIHVTGSLDKGYQLEIVRGYDISKSRVRPMSPIEIGLVPADMIKDTPTDDKLVKESTPRDRLEAFLASVPPPSASLNSATATSAVCPSYHLRPGKSRTDEWWR